MRTTQLMSAGAVAAAVLFGTARLVPAREVNGPVLTAATAFIRGTADTSLKGITAEPAMPAIKAALGALTSAPASIIGVSTATLRKGNAADVCVFDPAHSWTIRPDALRSQGKNTPYLGLELQGRVRYTLLAGHVVHEM